MTKITKTMTFAEILSVCPAAPEIFAGYGMHCIGCHLSPVESLEEGAKAHGISEAKIAEMVAKLNKSME
jgi:hybrid cluster-associated redox disulfide protein